MKLIWPLNEGNETVPNTDAEILLTADRTLMSNHNKNEFLGFGATAPPDVLPERLHRRLFFLLSRQGKEFLWRRLTV